MSSLLLAEANLLRAEDGLGARLFADVQQYAALGPHRAGTPGDAKTVEWLQSSLDKEHWSVASRPTVIEPFAEYDGCDLLVDGRRHDCFRVWLPNNTAIENVRAALASTGANLTNRLAVVDVSSPTLGSHGAGRAIDTAIARGAAAIAVVNHLARHEDPTQPEPHGGWPLVALNSPPPYSQRQWRVPVAVIGSAARAALLANNTLAGGGGALVNRMHVRGRCCGRGVARSLIAAHRLAPPPPPSSSSLATTTQHESPPSAPPPPIRLIASTPISGWFECGGERGVGVALWLHLSRALPPLLKKLLREHHHHATTSSTQPPRQPPQHAPPPKVEVLLLATNLHELGYGGARTMMDTLLKQNGFTPNGTALFISLGASIITRRYYHDDARAERDGLDGGGGGGGAGGASVSAGIFRASLDYTHPSLTPILRPYRAAGFQPSLNPPDRRGELKPIADAGYRAFGFYGEHARFHTPLDHAESTTPELLELVAAPTLKAIEEVVRGALVAGGRTLPPLLPVRADHDHIVSMLLEQGEGDTDSAALLTLLLAGVALARRRRRSPCTVLLV